MLEDIFKDWKIEGVAALDQHGRIWHMEKPFRHHNVLHLMLGSGSQDTEQGFYVRNNLGKMQFATRKLALLIATQNGQLIPRTKPNCYKGPELFSEDLW